MCFLNDVGANEYVRWQVERASPVCGEQLIVQRTGVIKKGTEGFIAGPWPNLISATKTLKTVPREEFKYTVSNHHDAYVFY